MHPNHPCVPRLDLLAHDNSLCAVLPSWNDTPTKAVMISFVEKVTQKGSSHFVAPEDRVAAFDNDGTFWTERTMYTQLAFVIARVQAMAPDHPEWKDKDPSQ